MNLRSLAFVSFMVGVLCMPVVEELGAIPVWAYSVCTMRVHFQGSVSTDSVMGCSEPCYEGRGPW